MLKMTADEIRESYLKFFESKEHLRLPSFSLVPVDDPTLLLIGAGMAPLKPYFRGEAKPPNTRITTSQKCIRVGDIENVGKTARHHTFFEMLGNFSFGDYFKKETCAWAWEYMVDVLKLPEEKLYVTIHPEDDEAEDIWINHVGIPKEKIYRDGGNFWGPIGDTGPCGPCSEILVDQGEDFSCGSPDCKPGCDCDRYLEIWNLVFTGLNKNEQGEYVKLPKPCIDTGLGFERLVCYLHGKKNDFETELFMPLINVIEKQGGIKYGNNPATDRAMKIISDHSRAVIFMACDGITPSNEGRGYVMRRLLRRSIRLARELGLDRLSLTVFQEPLLKMMGHLYPELKEKFDFTNSIIRAEEENFRKTLNQGIALLENILERIERDGGKILPGNDMFSLYDTYGFPFELTEEIAVERGFEIDREGFNKALEEQRKRAKAAMTKKLEGMGADLDLSAFESEFTGYHNVSEKAKVLALFVKGKEVESAKSGDEVSAVFDKTCFYGESGGQVGDTGIFGNENCMGTVADTRSSAAKVNLHILKIEKGELKKGDELAIEITGERRRAIMRHHSATHLLQGALRQVLGSHVGQMGSMVDSNRLRFDFSHQAAMTTEEIEEVEQIVNKRVLENVPVSTEVLPIGDALKKGALAFFGEKYDDQVRLVTMGDFSKELCGGTHVSRTGDIGMFKVTSESAIGMGIRRIEAVCGLVALRRVQDEERILRDVSRSMVVDFAGVPGALARQRDIIKSLEKELKDAKSKILHSGIDEFLSSQKMIEEVPCIIEKLDDMDKDDLRKTADLIGDRLPEGIIILAAVGEGKVSLIVKVSDDLVKKGISAVPLIRGIAKIVGGGGGGRPNMAQAGGKEPEKVDEALSQAPVIIKEEIGKTRVRN